MKISAKQYARGLADSLIDRSVGEQKKIIARFVSLLKKQRRLKTADQIVKQLECLFLASDNAVVAEVWSARPLVGETRQEVEKMVKEKTACREVVLIEKIDPAILGGVVVKYGDKINDGSFRYFLRKIKQALIS